MLEQTPAFSRDQLVKVARAVIENSPEAMAVVDASLDVIASNEDFRRLIDTAPVGAPILATNDGAWSTTVFEEALRAVLDREEAFFDIPLPWSGPLFVSGRSLQTKAGPPPPLVVLVFTTVPARERAEDVLADDPLLAQEIIAATRDPLIVVDYDRRVRWANNAFCILFRLDRPDIRSEPLAAIADGAFDFDALRLRIDAILRDSDVLEDIPVEGLFAVPETRAFRISARRIDHLRLILLTLDDVTQQRRDERHADTLVTELAHRAKNLLAVIQSLAFQTQADTVEGFRTAFIGRTKALALAQGALIDAQWHHADLARLIEDIVRNQAGEEATRVAISGPTVRLSPLQATTFALVINELVTNALVHGALSNPAGTVAISWTRSADKLDLDWEERGGPLIESTPEPGFGTTLITRAVNLQLGGLAELEFRREGLAGHLEMALTD
ncbi:MAG: HWE histidine kinase domain-containing protein [Bauldia sp.]